MIERLKALRQAWGWSQAQVAKMLRVAGSTLSRWERGLTRPQPANQEKLDALVTSLVEASAATSATTPPSVDIQINGDMVGGDKHIAGDAAGGNMIKTADGTTYIIHANMVIIVANPAPSAEVSQSTARE